MSRTREPCIGVLAAALTLLVAAGAGAQEISFGYQFQHFTAGGEGSSNVPLGFLVDAAYPVDEDVMAVGQFDWSRESLYKTTIDYSTVGAGLRLSGGSSRRAAPFLQAVGGAIHVRTGTSGGTNFMLEVAGGETVPVANPIAAFLEAGYRRIFIGGGGINVLRGAAGIRIELK